jgi:DNA-directed RNA polymerase subunit RPC12/RpoP
MPYGSSGKLPMEMASKLGHLSVIQSKWVRSLIEDFENSTAVSSYSNYSIWNDYVSTGILPLKYIWAVDGSFVAVKSNPPTGKEVAFIKVALISIDKNKMDQIDKLNPHPLLLQDMMTESALFHATVLPLKNIKTSMGNNFDSVRNIIFDSLKNDENGAYLETLKWIAYEKWNTTPTNSPRFECPHCGKPVDGLEYDVEQSKCRLCGGKIFLTDMIGFHLDMNEESAPESIASSYMLVVETLMLLTIIRILWNHSNKSLISDTLFIKDGPLTLRSQYSKLVPNIRRFIEFAKQGNRPIHLISQEKSGIFYDHLKSIVKYVRPKEIIENPSIAVLSHRYVRDEVYRAPDLSNPYGKRTNWGEKVFVKLDPDTSFVLNIPTGEYSDESEFPMVKDIIGLDKIMATLPSLVSRKFEGALFPIELANGVASMSSYPSSKVLERFIEIGNHK